MLAGWYLIFCQIRFCEKRINFFFPDQFVNDQSSEAGCRMALGDQAHAKSRTNYGTHRHKSINIKLAGKEPVYLLKYLFAEYF
jgi:hypothetical protein